MKIRKGVGAMTDISILTKDSLSNYFTYLEETGYAKDTNVFLLLLLGFIGDFLIGYKDYLTQDDYSLLYSLINCLSNSSCYINQSSCDFTLLDTDN